MRPASLSGDAAPDALMTGKKALRPIGRVCLNLVAGGAGSYPANATNRAWLQLSPGFAGDCAVFRKRLTGRSTRPDGISQRIVLP